MKRILLSTGEISGEQHAAYLIDQVKARDPSIHFYGMGSDILRSKDVHVIVDNRELSIVGIFEILTHLPIIFRAMGQLKKAIHDNPPDLLILVDYSGFNLTLAKYAKKHGVKILYFVSPQLWAWRYGRMETIKQCVDKMAVILPFEEQLYQKENIPVSYVGHPLAQKPLCELSKEEARHTLGLDLKKRVIGLLPGSRRGEITRLLPLLLGTATELQKNYPDVQLVLPLAKNFTQESIQHYLENFTLPIKIVEQSTHAAMRASDVLIMASGTATLEASLIGTPMVVTYKVGFLNYWLARFLIKGLKHISLCNIIAGKAIVPEFVQHDATVKNLSAATVRYLEDSDYYDAVVNDLQTIKNQLSSKHSTNIGDVVLEMMG